MNLNVSFLLFFGSLAGIGLLILRKSVAMTRHEPTYTDAIFHLYPWYVPNLHKWKIRAVATIRWFRDISLRHWIVWLIGQIKYFLYKLLRKMHKGLLGIIKVLERHEESMKERLREQGDLPSGVHDGGQRLISTLSKKQFPDKPVNER